MDRSNIEKIAKTPEDRVLLAYEDMKSANAHEGVTDVTYCGYTCRAGYVIPKQARVKSASSVSG